MRFLSLLLLPGCLFAPARPSDPIVDGQDIALDPSSCLGTFFLETYAVGASTIDDGDAIWRAAIVDGKTHVWEFVPSAQTDANCFEVGFTIPDETGHPVAIDATRVGDQVVVAVMIASSTTSFMLSFAEIAIASDNHALLSSSIATSLSITPDTLANSDSISDYTPRYLHRTNDGLWFGGGDQVGLLPETTIGVLAAPMLRSIPQHADESFVDAIPPGIAIGEADICRLDAELNCTEMHARPCVPGNCHIQSTGAVSVHGFVGFAAEQDFATVEGMPNPAEVDLIPPGGQVTVVALSPALDLPYFQGGTVTPAGDSLALWYPDPGGPSQPGELDIYRDVVDSSGVTQLPLALGPAPAYGEDTVVVYGRFAGVDAAVILGDRPADLSCYEVDTAVPCTKP